MKSYTNLEQSKKLAEILPLESADMCYYYKDDKPQLTPYSEHNNRYYIPCWSLAALLEIIPSQLDGWFQFLLFPCYNSDDWSCCYENEDANYFGVKTKYGTYGGNPVDACVEMIYKLKERNLL